jgi:hypothetical protein
MVINGKVYNPMHVKVAFIQESGVEEGKFLLKLEMTDRESVVIAFESEEDARSELSGIECVMERMLPGSY